jgi:hypothetical protein
VDSDLPGGNLVVIIRPYEQELDLLGVVSPLRSAGLHMSEIYNDYYQRADPKRFKGGKLDMVRMAAGTVLESVFEQALAIGMAGERPGEFVTDEGIFYSPDIIAFEGKIVVLGEIKVTWMSATDVPISPTQAKKTGLTSTWDGKGPATFGKKFNKYFTQMKCYCYHLQTPYARLYIYFVNGDWKPPVPVFLAWDFEFSMMELKEEWAMMRNHAIKVMGRKL